MFATLTGFIASMFVQPNGKAAESEVQQLAQEVRTLSDKIDAMKAAQPAEHEVLGNNR